MSKNQLSSILSSYKTLIETPDWTEEVGNQGRDRSLMKMFTMSFWRLDESLSDCDTSITFKNKAEVKCLSHANVIHVGIVARRDATKGLIKPGLSISGDIPLGFEDGNSCSSTEHGMAQKVLSAALGTEAVVRVSGEVLTPTKTGYLKSSIPLTLAGHLNEEAGTYELAAWLPVLAVTAKDDREYGGGGVWVPIGTFPNTVHPTYSIVLDGVMSAIDTVVDLQPDGIKLLFQCGSCVNSADMVDPGSLDRLLMAYGNTCIDCQLNGQEQGVRFGYDY